MEFKLNASVFKNTPEDQKRLYGDNYDPDKNYPAFSGTLPIPRSQILSLVEHLQYAVRTELKHDEYLGDVAVPIKISGWQKTSEKTGKKFLSLSYQPDYKTMTAARDAKEAAELTDTQEIMQHQQSLDQAAASLAQGTAGTVVKPQQDDIF